MVPTPGADQSPEHEWWVMTGVPDTGVPDTGVPDTGVPDTGVPDTGVPDTGVPDTGGGEPHDLVSYGPLSCPPRPQQLVP